MALPWLSKNHAAKFAVPPVVAKDLDTADVDAGEASVRGVDDEESARYPFVDIACQDLGSGYAIDDRVALGDPVADEDR